MSVRCRIFLAVACGWMGCWTWVPGMTTVAPAAVWHNGEAAAQDGKAAAGEPAQEPTAEELPTGMKLFRGDAGTWDAKVTFWLTPTSQPIGGKATVTASLTMDDSCLEQRFAGTLGPELGGGNWSSFSGTRFNSTTREFECVRMAGSETPMFLLRGKPIRTSKGEAAVELVGEYQLGDTKARERDLVFHPTPDQCVIESWLSFNGGPEYKGMEMVLTRTGDSSPQQPAAGAGPPVADGAASVPAFDPPLGNFSISLTVKDLETSRAFYELLGFRLKAGDGKSYLVLQNDSATIGLFQGLFDRNSLTFNPGWDREGNALATFEDVREIQRKLQERGLKLSTTTEADGTGPAYIALEDPDGNPILIDQHVPKSGK